MKIYDKENRKLIVLEEKTSPNFWDKHWGNEKLINRIREGKSNRYVKYFTCKFLKLGRRILEGGCGMGQNVYGLKSWGYDTYGVDFAPNTIKRIKENFPELKVFVQDVRRLDFPENFFDGYWSLGVIEHFWKGYKEILKEARRVIKRKGYLFLTFPYMSPLRKLKAKLGFYKILQEDSEPKNFYQFILDEKKVKADVEKYGFRLVLSFAFGATKCIKDEISLLSFPFQKVYDSKKLLEKVINFLIEISLAKIAGHMVLLVFQKK